MTPPGSEESVLDRIHSVKGPRPILSRARSRALTKRQQELLDDLTELFQLGFAHLTMADLASELNCSLRTLYAMAPSRDDLVLVAVDRNLWQVGRTAVAAITDEMTPIEAIRAHLSAANVAVESTTEAFANDCAGHPATRALQHEHSIYLVAVTRELLNMAVERGQLAPLNTAAAAQVVAGLGEMLSSPEVLPTLNSTPKRAANEMLDVILAGLPRPR